MTQGGFGVTAQIDVSGSPTTWVKIKDIDFPNFKKFLAESTTHDSTQGYKEMVATGKRELQGFRVTLEWDTAQATHAAVVTAFNADTPVTISVADPDGDETIAFEAHIEEIQRISRQESDYTAEVLVTPTGPPTIT